MAIINIIVNTWQKIIIAINTLFFGQYIHQNNLIMVMKYDKKNIEFDNTLSQIKSMLNLIYLWEYMILRN